MATKRSHDGSSSGCIPAKRSVLPSVSIGTISSKEELDTRVLKFQNKKLWQHLEQSRSIEQELRARILKQEQRHQADEEALCLVNRYWNQLDSDIMLLLHRLDASIDTIEEDIAEEINKENAENDIVAEKQDSPKKMRREATESFIELLSSSDQKEDHLDKRLAFSVNVLTKLLDSIDKHSMKNEELTKKLNSVIEENCESDNLILNNQLKECLAENKNLQDLVTGAHSREHVLNMKLSELEDKVALSNERIAELKTELEDTTFALNKTRTKIGNLERFITESLEEKALRDSGNSSDDKLIESGKYSSNKLDDVKFEAEELRQLASSRLVEVEEVQSKVVELQLIVDKLTLERLIVPEYFIMDTMEYKCLQSQFSVLYNDSIQLKGQLDEARTVLQQTKNNHLRQIEQMESDELSCQRKLRTEVINLEDNLAQIRKEYEMLRIEFEQNLAANEQAGPVNKELRHMISSLQNTSHMTKSEIIRYKRKFKDVQADLLKLRSKVKLPVINYDKQGSSSSKQQKYVKEEDVMLDIKQESGSNSDDVKGRNCKTEYKDNSSRDDYIWKKDIKLECLRSISELDEDYKKLKHDYKKLQDQNKELKLLIEMVKTPGKDSRERSQLLSNEKRLSELLNPLKLRLRELEDLTARQTRKLEGDETVQKLKQAETMINHLQKQVTSQKQEQEAILGEAEVTGQAYEDMMDQNNRLLQQLKEKDEANFKLMSERIKSNQIHKLLQEEKDVLADQVRTLQTQVEAQNQVVRKLEDKERVLTSGIATIEKEVSFRNQAAEVHKRKAMECAQAAAEINLHLEKMKGQMSELQRQLKEKATLIEQEKYKNKRSSEQVELLKKKVERLKRLESASSADQVLLEEINIYKSQLRCPCCNSRDKDAVLTKCFHVFCYDCITLRYQTRQRKCPKCNAGFGTNDFHRIYF